jgi:hypothetical protein
MEQHIDIDQVNAKLLEAAMLKRLRPPRPRRRPIDFKAIRSQVTIGQVLELLRWNHRSRNGPQLRGPCPIHLSKSPKSRTFAVNIQRSVWYCHKCNDGGNQLDLWAAATGLKDDPYGAAIELCEKLGIQIPYLETQKRET